MALASSSEGCLPVRFRTASRTLARPAVMAFGHGNNTVHCLANANAVDHGMHGGAAHANRDIRRPRAPVQHFSFLKV